nr:esterase-like activity of phytase family protein [Sulfitobacter guttiformis]
MRPDGVLRWQIEAPWFGGWSGIEVTGQGTRMTVITDRGHLLEALLRRDRSGVLETVEVQSFRPLTDENGRRLGKKATDAEGLAIAENGHAFVSFEHRHRIMDLDPQTGRTGNRIALPFRNSLGDNSGIEALAIGLDGTLFALTEAAPARGHPFPLYTYTDGQWRVAAHIPQRGPFVPVGADIDALGRFWLLERTVTPIGFRSRVRMFVLDPHAPREYTLMTSIPARYDNLEGISVWSDQDGLMHVTLISDDNFFALQRTQIVEFVVIE